MNMQGMDIAAVARGLSGALLAGFASAARVTTKISKVPPRAASSKISKVPRATSAKVSKPARLRAASSKVSKPVRLRAASSKVSKRDAAHF